MRLKEGGADRKLLVLGVCGSPRKGNSEFLLRRALASVQETYPRVAECVAYSMRHKKFSPCISCYSCFEHQGRCAIEDDFQELRTLWFRADVIIYSVPVYHMGIPGQLKCFLDRLGCTTFGEYSKLFADGEEKLPKLFKIIGAIAQGAHQLSGQEHTIAELINHAMIMQCIPVTGDLWRCYTGAGGWTSNDSSKYALEHQVRQSSFDALAALRSAEELARRAVELAMVVRQGIVAAKNSLPKDPVYIPLIEQLNCVDSGGDRR